MARTQGKDAARRRSILRAAHEARVSEHRRQSAAKRAAAVFPRASEVTITRADGTVLTAPPLSPAQLRRVAPMRTPIPRDLRAAVLRRDRRACRYCGDDRGPFDIDHVTPVALGGATNLRNLVTACKPCNTRKGASVWTPRPLARRR